MSANRPSNTPRRLIVTADDFGAAEWIDEGILAGINTGQVTTVSALTNYPRARDSILRLQRTHPHIDVGIHLNVTSGPPLTDAAGLRSLCTDDGQFPGLPGLLARLQQLDFQAIEAELRAQIQLVQEAGIRPDHLSSHHNILAYYPLLQEIMIRLALEYDIPVRTPLAVSQTHMRRYGYARTRKRAAQSVIQLLGRRPVYALWTLPGAYIQLRRSKRVLRQHGVRTPDHMIDALYGLPTVRNIRHILLHLPPGISELVVHLADEMEGYIIPDGIELDGALNRPMERNLLTNGTVRLVMERENIEPARYSDIGRIA